MPTIQCSFTDLKQLYGEKLSLDEVKEGLIAAKAELEQCDNDILTIKLGDTNQPYLWSVEGLVRFLRHFRGIEHGIPKIRLAKTKNMIVVDQKLTTIRPIIAAFTAKGKPLTDYLIKQLIQMQEKIGEGFGRRRQKVAIGIYPSRKITFPLRYYAADPEKTAFIPLDGTTKENLRRITEYHPKGNEYSWILKDAKYYPILEDASSNILSFPPIINSENTGRVTVGDDSLFFEATGTDHSSVQLVATIFAYALAERGFSVEQVTIKYQHKEEDTPVLKEEYVTITPEHIKALLGIELKKNEIVALLKNAQYDVTGNKVKIPPYRGDVLHMVDIIEDIGIMYGYNKISPLPLTTYTIGSVLPKIQAIEKFRELLIGLGYQEVLSPVLSSKDILCHKMNTPDKGTVEIDNVMSQTYSAVRTWLLPVLLEMLAKNKHADYPQMVFEQGIVTKHADETCVDSEHLAVLSCHNTAEYTEMRQVLDHMFLSMGLKYAIIPADYPAFISGRSGDIIINKKKIGFIGEINPSVLENIGLDMPAAGMELDLSALQKSNPL